ncbi:DUF4376 domain-containing protein [Nitrosomonas sp.]|uniref:DUF4376 domain-containing protein n=1 Tax=Nitrosomonas sp. TaxID=42353 RepID=UPI001D741061|nr:DUF4376 domain-containing protein [Nitrosomonas sp.]MCB1949128.1 DUF4376 domain-containing protein [Nitrosomonas sp.]
MPYLLVNAPSGRQEIIEIGSTGNYFDIASVIWDERIDGAMPAVTLGKMERSGSNLITLEDYTAPHLAAVLAETKAAKLVELKAAYDAANYADIDHNSKTWKADKEAQELLAAVLSVGSVPGGMYWRDITETQNAMTFADLQALAAAILARGLTLDSNLDTKKAAVAAATTVSEVDAITW